jgi:chemotaxis protein CheX
MVDSQKIDDEALLRCISEAVIVAVERTYAAICGEKPIAQTSAPPLADYPCVAAIISFFGDVPWSLSWVLPRDTAVALSLKFAGFDIPFDSSDMGDVVGELVNVLAGDVVAELEKRRMKAQMSLPTVARGSHLTLLPEKSGAVGQLNFRATQGACWFRLATAHVRPSPTCSRGK